MLYLSLEQSDDLDDLNFFNQKKKKKKPKKVFDNEVEEGIKVSSVVVSLLLHQPNWHTCTILCVKT